jgi:16S rRNA (guanine527-N7)-methyltransferase
VPTDPNGLICLKGGDLASETAMFRKITEVMEIKTWFKEEFFKDKKVIYVQL